MTPGGNGPAQLAKSFQLDEVGEATAFGAEFEPGLAVVIGAAGGDGGPQVHENHRTQRKLTRCEAHSGIFRARGGVTSVTAPGFFLSVWLGDAG